LIEQEMRHVTRHNVVAQQAFSERLAELMRKYTNQNLTTSQIIAELVALAKDVSADARRGEQFAPPLSNDERAFYDAVAQNEVCGDRDGRDGARGHREGPGAHVAAGRDDGLGVGG
jgi:type I restriction enzyme R subunit